MGRDDVYLVRTSKAGCLLHCSAVGDRHWTSLLDIYHPDPWHASVAATTVYVLLMIAYLVYDIVK